MLPPEAKPALTCPDSEEDRGQVWPAGLVVKSDRHQCHGFDHAQPVGVAPAQQLSVAIGDVKAGAGKAGSGGYQCLEVVVGLGNRVPHETYAGAVAGNAAASL